LTALLLRCGCICRLSEGPVGSARRGCRQRSARRTFAGMILSESALIIVTRHIV
jgi:hypothetical protein